MSREIRSRTASVYARSLRLGSIVTLGIAGFGSVLGFLVSGVPGILSALLGAGLALVFMGLTAVSILVATKVMDGATPDGRYFGIVIGTWMFKLVVFVVFTIWLGSQDWLSPGVFSVAAIVAVIGLLVADVIAFQTTRIPYVDVPLPGDSVGSSKKTPPIL